MITTYSRGLSGLTSDNHDNLIAQGYIHFVRCAYTTYYFNNIFEAQFIANKMKGRVETEEKEVVMCSKCQRYLSQDGTWQPEPDVAIIPRDLATGIYGNITETYCPECLNDRLEEI